MATAQGYSIQPMGKGRWTGGRRRSRCRQERPGENCGAEIGALAGGLAAPRRLWG